MDKKSRGRLVRPLTPYLSVQGLWYCNCFLVGMNWRQVENQWQQFRNFAKRHWHKLSDDDLNGIAGRKSSLVKMLELRYNMTHAEAEHCAEQWLRIPDGVDTVDM